MNEKEHREANEDQEVVNDIKQELVDEEPAGSEEDTEETVQPEDTELEAVKQEKEEVYQRLLRLQAEYDNFRKRTQKEKEAAAKYKSQTLATELLPVVDNLERALQTQVNDDAVNGFVEGIQMVHRQLKAALEKEGLEEIKTTGETFDPHVHQAVMQVEDDQYESNTVVEELQKGYMLKDRVIRPAMVKVNQ